MIIITVKFNKEKGKSYQYLLINPNHYKIDKDKPLVYNKGAGYNGNLQTLLYPIEAERVDSLPPIVTSQIRLLDGNNTISVERLGMVAKIPKIKKKETTSKTVSTAKKPPEQKKEKIPIKPRAKKKKGYFDELIEKETKKFEKWCRNYLMKSR